MVQRAHDFAYGHGFPEDDVDEHRHLIEVAGSTVEVGLTGDHGDLEVLLPRADSVPIDVARRVAVAILAACETVEGTPVPAS